MAVDCEIWIKGYIDFRGVMRDPEKPKEVKVGYKGTRALTPTPEQTEMVLNFAAGVASSMLATVLSNLIYKHANKEKSDTITIDRQTVTVDKGQIKKVIEEHITRVTKK